MGQTTSARSTDDLTNVGRVGDERAYLFELIQTIGAGPDLDAILRGVVRLVSQATGCHACFVYFLDGEILTLRAASSTYEHLEGEVRIPLGEGLTGWVARARRSAHIREKALEDPRVRRAAFAELDDDVYQSLVSVPIFTRSGEVIGVITLHADAPHEFARADLDFLEHTASLIAGAIENARLYEEATGRVALLEDLSRLSQEIASAGSMDDLLTVVTRGGRELLRADRCEIHLIDADGRLHLRSADPTRAERSPMPEASRGAGERRGAATIRGGSSGTTISLEVPLVAGEDRLGLLSVVLSAPMEDAEATLSALAAHTAVAIRQHQVIERLTERSLVRDFFLTLARADATPREIAPLADRLEVRLDLPHVILHVVPWRGAPASPSGAGSSPPGTGNGRADGQGLGDGVARTPSPTGQGPSWNDVAGQVEARLAARFLGVLSDGQEDSIRALVPLGELEPDAIVASLREMDLADLSQPPSLSLGVSNPTAGPTSFDRAIEEARSAAEVGALIRGEPGVTTFEDLGPYKYVLASDEGVRDRSQERLEKLVDYDGERGTRLLDTLEGYLDHRGNVVGTSRALFIHPNTLRQRLARIERVSGVDLEHDDWLSLAVATKVVKLRRMRRTAGSAEGGGTDG